MICDAVAKSASTRPAAVGRRAATSDSYCSDVCYVWAAGDAVVSCDGGGGSGRGGQPAADPGRVRARDDPGEISQAKLPSASLLQLAHRIQHAATLILTEVCLWNVAHCVTQLAAELRLAQEDGREASSSSRPAAGSNHGSVRGRTPVCHTVDVPPCKMHTAYVWHILQGGLGVHVHHWKRWRHAYIYRGTRLAAATANTTPKLAAQTQLGAQTQPRPQPRQGSGVHRAGSWLGAQRGGSGRRPLSVQRLARRRLTVTPPHRYRCPPSGSIC